MSQTSLLLDLLLDLRPHRTDEIVEKVYGPKLSLARVGARIWDIKRKLPSSQTIRGWHDKENPALYWYQIVESAPETPIQHGLFGGAVGESA